MALNTDRSGGGVRWFFGAVALFLVAYFHDEVWAVLKAVWQLAIEPHLPR